MKYVLVLRKESIFIFWNLNLSVETVSAPHLLVSCPVCVQMWDSAVQINSGLHLPAGGGGGGAQGEDHGLLGGEQETRGDMWQRRPHHGQQAQYHERQGQAYYFIVILSALTVKILEIRQLVGVDCLSKGK